MRIIRIENLSKVYVVGAEKVVALRDINLDIEEGEFCCILGTSGSGKSTLLNMAAGLEKPTRGNVIIKDQCVNLMSENRLALFRQVHIGFIFQSYNLMSTMTARENVAMPLMFRGVSAHERNKAALTMLANVGLLSHYKHKPTQMSGGQQQRVGIARAFVGSPEIVFADEPTGNLDTRTREEVMDLMIRISRRRNHTLVMVTHDNELAQYADRVVRIRDGRLDGVTVTENGRARAAALADAHAKAP